MSARLLLAPRWVTSVVYGVVFGLLTVVFRVLLGAGVSEVLFSAFFEGAVFGLFMGPVITDLNGDALKSLDPLPVDQRLEALRAAKSGPLPADPEVRAAASRYARERLAMRLRRRWANVLVGVGLMLVFGGLSVVHPWSALGIVLGLTAIANARWDVFRLERRLPALEGTASDV